MKRYGIESRATKLHPDIVELSPFTLKWHDHCWYETEKQRNQALKILQAKAKRDVWAQGWEYRKKDRR